VTAQELIAYNNESNTKSLFKAARKVPADKIEWRPLDGGRSVLDVCQECALSPTWPLALITSNKPFEMTPEIMAQYQEAKEALKPLDDCEKTAEENVAKLNEAVLAFPDSKMGDTIPMSMWPGGQMPAAEALQLHNWNVSYHTGQVNYIQTLYGDHSM
jgi:uncharacterized damage-inducible protein DinB